MVLPQSMDECNEILPLKDPFDLDTLSRKHVQPKNYRKVMCCISSVIIFVLVVALAYTYRSEIGHVGVEQFSVDFIGTRIDNKDADSPGASISGTKHNHKQKKDEQKHGHEKQQQNSNTEPVPESMSNASEIHEIYVAIPSIARQTNITTKAIELLNVAIKNTRENIKPKLIWLNANDAPEKHTVLIENVCQRKDPWVCCLPDNDFEKKFSTRVECDTRLLKEEKVDYESWMQKLSLNLAEVLSIILKIAPSAKYIVSIQDDVLVQPDFFNRIFDHMETNSSEAVCLVKESQCGDVAWVYKRAFVEDLIPKLLSCKHIEPADWLRDKVIKSRNAKVDKLPIATHGGRVSTSGAIREFYSLKQ